MFQLCCFVNKFIFLMLLFLMCMTMVSAQKPVLNQVPQSMTASVNRDGLSETEPPVMVMPADILKRFLLTEARFREKMNQSAFKRDVILQTIGPDGLITGEYIRNSRFFLDDRGGRVEKVLYHPKSTIREMKITREDIQDLACAQLFGFEITDMSRYDLTYVGQEAINLRQTFAIDVRPQQAPDPQRMSERFFVGRIWVDALSFQIVKMRGQTLPQGKQRFPIFTTSRAQLVGSDLLFPVSTFADEVLHFPKRDVHYRVTVRYYDYKRFASKVSFLEIDEP